MVLLRAPDEGAREYMERTQLLPSLECGLEDMLQACTADGDTDPLTYLAEWLMRHNPRHDAGAARRIEEHRAESKAREARAVATREAHLQTLSDSRQPFTLSLGVPGGELALRVDLDRICDDA